MRKLFLHVGSYKTGTTAIQTVLAKNRQALAKQGFKYPGREVNHHKFIFSCKPTEKDIPRQFRGINQGKLSQIASSFISELETDFKGIYNNQILSTEYLFVHDKTLIEKSVNYLKTFFSEIEVIVFIRNPIDYVTSFQQQAIKARSYIDLSTALQYDFKKVIETWKTFFPVKVLEYNRHVDSLEVFCNEIGIDKSNFQNENKRSNTSLNIEQMLLLEKIQNRLYQDYEDQFKNHLAVLHQIKYLGTHKPNLKDDVKKLIYKNHYEDLLWLKEHYGIDFVNEKYEMDSTAQLQTFKEDKVTVRDVFEVPDEQLVEKYEAHVIDALLKTLLKQSTAK